MGFSKVCSRLLVCHHSALGLSEAKWQFLKPLSFLVNVKRMQKYTQTKPGKQGLSEIVQSKRLVQHVTPRHLCALKKLWFYIFLISCISILSLGFSLHVFLLLLAPLLPSLRSLLTSDVISVGGRLKGERGCYS